MSPLSLGLEYETDVHSWGDKTSLKYKESTASYRLYAEFILKQKNTTQPRILK